MERQEQLRYRKTLCTRSFLYVSPVTARAEAAGAVPGGSPGTTLHSPGRGGGPSAKPQGGAFPAWAVLPAAASVWSRKRTKVCKAANILSAVSHFLPAAGARTAAPRAAGPRLATREAGLQPREAGRHDYDLPGPSLRALRCCGATAGPVCPSRPPPAQDVTTAEAAISGAVGVGRSSCEASRRGERPPW